MLSSNEVRNKAGVRPVEGPGSEKRTFFLGCRGVVAVVVLWFLD